MCEDTERQQEESLCDELLQKCVSFHTFSHSVVSALLLHTAGNI